LAKSNPTVAIFSMERSFSWCDEQHHFRHLSMPVRRAVPHHRFHRHTTHVRRPFGQAQRTGRHQQKVLLVGALLVANCPQTVRNHTGCDTGDDAVT